MTLYVESSPVEPEPTGDASPFTAVEGGARPRLSVVVPTYREADNLELLVHRITAALERDPRGCEIIIVDDDSRDRTEEVVAALARSGHNVRLIVRKNERGLSSAVLRGFREARGDLLICMDADLSHPPESLLEMTAAVVRDGADFVIGSRYVSGASTDADWGAFRWLNSKIATALARPFTRAKDPMSGFFALPRAVFERGCDFNPVGYKIGLELLVKCRCDRIIEIPIHFADRRHGESKLNAREQFNYLKHIKRLFDYKYGPFSRFAQFCVVGASGVVVDLFSYTILLAAGAPLTLARAGAILVAMTSNFWLNRRLTFSYGRQGDVVRQYAQFVVSCALGAMLNWSVSVTLSLSVPFFHDQKVLAALIGILLGTVSNFLIASNWVFRRGKPAWQRSKTRSHDR